MFFFSLKPERINPPEGQAGYDIKADVWSLGITMVRKTNLCRTVYNFCDFLMLFEYSEMQN
jgi:hypothetical protein